MDIENALFIIKEIYVDPADYVMVYIAKLYAECLWIRYPHRTVLETYECRVLEDVNQTGVEVFRISYFILTVCFIPFCFTVKIRL